MTKEEIRELIADMRAMCLDVELCDTPVPVSVVGVPCGSPAELGGIMPPINPFDPTADRQGKIQKVVERLKEFFRRFASISNGDFGGM